MTHAGRDKLRNTFFLTFLQEEHARDDWVLIHLHQYSYCSGNPFKYYYFILFHTKHQSNLRNPIFHEPKMPLELQVGLRLVVAGSGNVLKEISEPAGVGGECIPFAPKFTDPVLHQGL